MKAVAAAHAQRITNSAVPLDGLLSLAGQRLAMIAKAGDRGAAEPAAWRLIRWWNPEACPEERQARARSVPGATGERTPGMNQVAPFLQAPPVELRQAVTTSGATDTGLGPTPCNRFSATDRTPWCARCPSARRCCTPLSKKTSRPETLPISRVLRRARRSGHLRKAPAGHVRFLTSQFIDFEKWKASKPVTHQLSE